MGGWLHNWRQKHKQDRLGLKPHGLDAHAPDEPRPAPAAPLAINRHYHRRHHQHCACCPGDHQQTALLTSRDRLHLDERRQLERLLYQQKIGRVADRLAIWEALQATTEHLSVFALQHTLLEKGIDLDPLFIAQTLELLTDLGLAARSGFEGSSMVYEHRHLGQHHDHLICTCCGSIQEFVNPALEQLQESVAIAEGFHPLRHNLQIYGLCKKCLTERQSTLPLNAASAGEKVCILRLNTGQVRRHEAGGGLRAYLTNLGLVPGTEVEVISSGNGTMVLAVKGSRVALGEGMAQHILVRQLPPEGYACGQ